MLASTAGGKTEAAVFPLLTRITAESWRGLAALYVTPLRASSSVRSGSSRVTGLGCGRR